MIPIRFKISIATKAVRESFQVPHRPKHWAKTVWYIPQVAIGFDTFYMDGSVVFPKIKFGNDQPFNYIGHGIRALELGIVLTIQF